VVVGHGDVVNVRDVLRRLISQVENAVERPLHVIDRQRVAAGKLHALPDREAPARPIRGALPLGRKGWLEVYVIAQVSS
jgi:hypothetical protein